MKYLLLVSHGGFSEGLKSTLHMFAQTSMDHVLTISLKPGESVESLGKRFESLLDKLPHDSQFVVLADIIGGSPLTTVCNLLNEHGKLQDSLVLGGMNFPMALTALLSKDEMSKDTLKQHLLSEAGSAIKVFSMPEKSRSDDEI